MRHAAPVDGPVNADQGDGVQDADDPLRRDRLVAHDFVSSAHPTLIERHDGRIVNTWAIVVIAEFANVVEVVQCTVPMTIRPEAGQRPEQHGDGFGARLILDGTVARVRLDRKATSISRLVALGVQAEGQKVLLAIKSMGGESEAAWRALLDDLVWRGLKTPSSSSPMARRACRRCCGPRRRSSLHGA